MSYYNIGYQDGYKNAPRAKGLKGINKTAYENGYKEGQMYRTLEGTRNNQVKDRKTGEWYNPQDRFDAMMNKPEIQAVFKRLAVR